MSTDLSPGGHAPVSHWPATLGRVLVYAVLLLAARFNQP